MKTVVEQLIEFVKSSNYNDCSDSIKNIWFELFLEKEKKQIKDAFEYGEVLQITKDRLDYCEEDQKYIDSEGYYNLIKKATEI
jgi:hypothetical protein